MAMQQLRAILRSIPAATPVRHPNAMPGDRHNFIRAADKKKGPIWSHYAMRGNIYYVDSRLL